MSGSPAQVGLAAEPAWAEELGRLAALAAHELNNLLNGVAVNLEVVRSRSARSAQSSAIVPFAETATTQLEALTPVIRGLVALARPVPGSVSVSVELGHIAAVVGSWASARGGSISVGVPVSEASTCVSGATARLLLASAVRTAAEPGIRVECSIATEGQESVVRLARPGLTGVELPLDAVRVAADAGIRIEHVAETLLLRFPAGRHHPTHQ